MNNVVTTNANTIVDGLSHYREPVGGMMNSQLGSRLKYLKIAKWVDADGDEVTSKLIATDVIRRIQEWPADGGAPISTRTIAPGEEWPDVAALNDACRDRWYEKFGKLTGPFVGEHVVVFLDPSDMEGYWWPSPVSTIGSCIAIRNLVMATQRMRSFRGERVFPLCRLSHAPMKTTNFGTLERAALDIENFVTIERLDTGRISIRNVEAISAKEEIGDEIKY
jgi:hypothetical protein